MRKLVWFCLGFALAIGLGLYLLPTDTWLLAAGISGLLLAVCLLFMLRRRQMRVPAMVAFAAAVGFLWLLGYDTLYLSTVRMYDDATVNITVTASDYSYETNYGAAVQGRVTLEGKTYRLLLYHDKETMLSPGDSLTGDFLLRSTLPEGAQSTQYYRSNRLLLTARPKGEITLTKAEKQSMADYPALVRNSILSWITRLFPADTAGFARALLLGDTELVDYETDTAFKLSGIRHVIAVSGLHVTILFSMVFLLTGRRKWITALLGLPVLFAFAAVAGFSPSITRACLMHGLMVIGMLFNKEYDSATALSFAVVCMLAADPWVVTNVGFQLSVSCIAGILLFSRRIQGFLMDPKRLGRWKGWRNKLAQWFASSVSVSLSACVITTPLCAGYFGVVSLIGPLTNLLTLWVITFIFYGIMLACVAGLLLPALGTGVAWVIAWLIRYVLIISKALSALPLAAVYTESVYVVLWLLFAYILLTVFMFQKKKRPVGFACCAAISLCLALAFSWTEPMLDDCRVTVLDVGQGQCVLLQSRGRNYLVDCGSYSDTHAADKAAGLLLSQGISRLDGVIVTHFDRDHAGGLPYLLTRVSTERLYLPESTGIDPIAQGLYAYTGGEVVMVSEDVSVTFEDVCITLIPSENPLSGNESGLCILFQREKCDILITGDRSAAGERELLAGRTLPDLEVLIVGHHGSKTSTCRELLIKTKPDIAIISVGADNSYGHPAQEVLDRLTYYGCRIFRTDLSGTVIYRG